MDAAIKSRRLRLLLGHYLAARGAKRLPSRSDIDAVELAPVLPIIWISQFEDSAGTFRYRLAGEDVNDIWGMSVAGCLLSDFVAPDRFEATNAAFLRVLQQEAALIASGPVYRCADRIALGERLVLPLSSDGVTADGLIGATARDQLVDFEKASMSQQISTYISVDELESIPVDRAVGD
ncbi:MAG: PAS domain-containing protein [Kiloniellaceae bacterium]